MKFKLCCAIVSSLLVCGACSDSQSSRPGAEAQDTATPLARIAPEGKPAVETMPDLYLGEVFRFEAANGTRFDGAGTLDIFREVDEAGVPRDKVHIELGGHANDHTQFYVSIHRLVEPVGPWQWQAALIGDLQVVSERAYASKQLPGTDTPIGLAGRIEITIWSGYVHGVVYANDELGQVQFWGWPRSACTDFGAGSAFRFEPEFCHPYAPIALTEGNRELFGLE